MEGAFLRFGVVLHPGVAFALDHPVHLGLLGLTYRVGQQALSALEAFPCQVSLFCQFPHVLLALLEEGTAALCGEVLEEEALEEEARLVVTYEGEHLVHEGRGLVIAKVRAIDEHARALVV